MRRSRLLAASISTVPTAAPVDTSGRIAVVTWTDRLGQFEPVETVMAAYCRHHGYDRIVDRQRRVPEWAPSWERIPLLMEVLPRYRAVLWLDDDAVVHQFNRTVESYLDSSPSKSFFLSRVERGNGFKGSPIMGVFIMRNAAYTRGLLRRSRYVSEACPKPRANVTRCCWEQECIWTLFVRDRPNVYHADSGSEVQFLRGADFNCIEQTRRRGATAKLLGGKTFHHLGRCAAPFIFHEMGRRKTGYVQGKARAVLQRRGRAGSSR